jgi:subtilisin family serine protease
VARAIPPDVVTKDEEEHVKRLRLSLFLIGVALAVSALPLSQAGAGTADTKRYIVVFGGSYAVDGNYAVGGDYAVNDEYAVDDEYAVGDQYAVGSCYAVDGSYAVGPAYAVGSCYAVAHDYAVGLVTLAGGTVTKDMMNQIGVLVVESANEAFAEIMRTYAVLNGYAVVEEVAEDFTWTAPAAPGGGGPEETDDTLESQQWSMRQIRTADAHKIQAGWRAVDVGILDTGIDVTHPDFDDDGTPGGGTNVDCARGHDSVPKGPSTGIPLACADNHFHGTHVAGIVAAQANGLGVTGVAPNVTLVPIKVCDSSGFCYASAAVDGITYAGDIQLDVLNMSFFADDGELLASTECKPNSDPQLRAFAEAVNRAVRYAVKRGATPIAAAGNSDTSAGDPVQDLDPNPGPQLSSSDGCQVVPQESPGVIAVAALSTTKQKTGYSSWGDGVDVAAPGGNGTGRCDRAVLSTFPVAMGAYGCVSGTSMASPHAAGVAALIVSQVGRLGSDGDVKSSPAKVRDLLLATTIDQGASGVDVCFGHGRVDALRAVQRDTSTLSDPEITTCVNP